MSEQPTPDVLPYGGNALPHPWISRLTVARLYNLGDYEHKRIELVVEMPHGQDVGKTLATVEGILERFEHKAPNDLDQYPLNGFIERQAWTEREWSEQDYADWQKTKADEAQAIQLAREENAAWEAKQAELRSLLNKLGVQRSDLP